MFEPVTHGLLAYPSNECTKRKVIDCLFRKEVHVHHIREVCHSPDLMISFIKKKIVHSKLYKRNNVLSLILLN